MGIEEDRSLAKRRRAAAILTLIALEVLVILYVSPIGEFPLNDDWVYARSVLYFLQTGKIKVHIWAAPTLIFQILWGAFFHKLLFFPSLSFTVLRLSTLVLATVGLIFFYMTLEELDFGEDVSFAGALLLAFNPLYLGLSFTFMTDVPFLALSLIATFFYVKGIRRERGLYLLLGSLFASLSFLVRQIGILLPAGVALFFLLNWKGLKPFLKAAALSAALPLATVAFYVACSHLFGPVSPETYRFMAFPLKKIGCFPGLGLLRFRIFSILAYLGFFLLPVSLPAFIMFAKESGKSRNRKIFWLALIFISALAFTMAYWNLKDGRLMPYFDWTLCFNGNFGLGPILLRDTFILGKRLPYAIPRPAWWAVTAISCAGGAIFLALLARGPFGKASTGESRWRQNAALPLYLAAGAFVVIFALLDVVFDRYLLTVVPAAIVALAGGLLGRLLPRRATLALIGILALISLFFARDYMSWNRARWKALDYLVREKSIPPEEIDGGLEFNTWFLVGKLPREEVGQGDKSWWWVKDDRFIIAFSQIEGYRILKKFPYRTPGSFRTQYIYALERIEQD